jgi:hypothetical protein
MWDAFLNSVWTMFEGRADHRSTVKAGHHEAWQHTYFKSIGFECFHHRYLAKCAVEMGFVVPPRNLDP